jgi:hypothetical protein
MGHPALQAECGSSRRVAVFLLSHPCAKKKAQGWGTGLLLRSWHLSAGGNARATNTVTGTKGLNHFDAKRLDEAEETGGG